MKKQNIIFSFFAALLAISAVSCKKDQDVVTLNAVIQKVSNDSKVYINDHTPYWHNGDQIRINDADYTLQTAMENSAQIPNVANSTSGYRAIFPAGILTNSNANINSSSSVAVTLPATQVFEMVGTHQRVDVPMGAFIDRGSTLQFHNLCSVVRVYVSNAINAQLPVTSITITAESANLSGAGTATITGSSTDAIVIPSATGSHSVGLCKTDNSPMKTVEPLATEYFDVIVPEFSTRNDVTVTVTTPTGYKSIPIEDAPLAHNTITTVTVNVDELAQTAAELVNGSTFNAAIPQNATAIRFEYNNAAVTSGTILSTSSSPYPIYGNMVDGTTWVVSTPANRINANVNCSNMFMSSAETYLPALTSIDFGNNFNTSNVTSMYRMFAYRRSLTSLNLSNFNTESVTNMDYMFYVCGGLTSLNISSFNTANVMSMGYMFAGCTSLTDLNLSNINTSNVTNMSCMFGGCSSLTSLNLSNFNTTNVNDMRYMFQNCTRLTSLNLYNFDMSGLSSHESGSTTQTGKYNMCSNLASVSGACAITCPTAIQAELQSGTGLVNSRITWYTH